MAIRSKTSKLLGPTESQLVRSGSGFTLVEVLVTCALLGLLVGGLAYVLTHFTKNLANLKRKMPSHFVVQAGTRIVTEDLESANRASVMNRLPNPGFEDFTNPPKDSAISLQGQWTFPAPRMDPFSIENDVGASFITVSPSGIQGSRAVCIRAQRNGVPFTVQSSTFVAINGGIYLAGARVWRRSGDASLNVQIFTDPSAATPVVTMVYPSGQTNWVFLSDSFVAIAGQTYQMRFVVNGGISGGEFIVDDAYCGPSTVSVTAASDMEPIFFSRTNNEGHQLNLVYSMVGTPGNVRLHRTVRDSLGNQRDMVLDGITSLVMTRPINGNWFDQAVRVQIQGQGNSQGQTDLAAIQVEVLPRAP